MLNDSRLKEPGDHFVDVPVVCVITRFGLRSVRFLLPTYFDYRRVLKQAIAAQTPGLLRATFLIENPKTCYSLSLWSQWSDIPYFGSNVPYHVDAARKIFERVSFTKERGPEIWSTKLRLNTISNNLNWRDFDLRESILKVSE